MSSWTKAQWDAYGRHILTAATSIIMTLAAVGFISGTQATEYVGHATTIVTAVIAIAATLGPLYAAWRAARSASPEKQAEATIKNLEDGVPINGKSYELVQAVAKAEPDTTIAAVAEMPEVRKVVVKDVVKAEEFPTTKVTAS